MSGCRPADFLGIPRPGPRVITLDLPPVHSHPLVCLKSVTGKEEFRVLHLLIPAIFYFVFLPDGVMGDEAVASVIGIRTEQNRRKPSWQLAEGR